MTKGELLEALQPFDDEIEVCVERYWRYTDNTQPAGIAEASYAMMKDGEGILMLILGDWKQGLWRYATCEGKGK